MVVECEPGALTADDARLALAGAGPAASAIGGRVDYPEGRWLVTRDVRGLYFQRCCSCC